MVSRHEKARRAKLRKQAGLKRFSELYAARAVREAPTPVRRAPVLTAYACFSCRKSFKKRFTLERDYHCPQCAGVLADMGGGFKAPRKGEQKQWQKVERLWTAGYRFRANTMRQRIAPFPHRLRDVDNWIAQNPTHPFRLRAYWPPKSGRG